MKWTVARASLNDIEINWLISKVLQDSVVCLLNVSFH